MLKYNIVAALLVLGFVKLSESAGTAGAGSPAPIFCYDETNPDCNQQSAAWSGACHTGQKQSPINFNVTYVPALIAALSYSTLPKQTLTFSGYKASSFYIVDNGHTVQIQLEPTATSSSKMTGTGVYNGNYIFAQGHMHWGKALGSGGSEHTIGGQHLTAEFHLVHYKEQYGSVAAAAASGDPHGIAVVGVLIKHTLLSPKQAIGNKAMAPIIANLPTQYDSSAKLVNKPIDLSLFLPRTKDTVMRYEGSLTTPGCNEVVLWNVVANPMEVNALELFRLHTVKGEEGEALTKNFRDVQPLNGRQIDKYVVA